MVNKRVRVSFCGFFGGGGEGMCQAGKDRRVFMSLSDDDDALSLSLPPILFYSILAVFIKVGDGVLI